ncbi:hypothetical protein [Amorphus sp. 3PC139-8]|uniref:hypothetical protein n=1 Tax=Amorphus sp. 3PC139-8 TaxID=2735676 RepID=UPI00345D3D51
MADYDAFLGALSADGFEGALSRRASDWVVMATDNSIYQVEPYAVSLPRVALRLIR